MGRFESLSSSPYETRRFLRDRLRRGLRPANEQLAFKRFPASLVADAEILVLLHRIHIHKGNDAKDVRAAYDTYRKAHPNSPTFDSLINDGWFQITWGRITYELRTRSIVNEQDESLRSALQVIFERLHQDTFTFDDVNDLSRPAQELAAKLANDPRNNRTVSAPSPDWIAARLWEQRPKNLDTAEALQWWVDRWILLGSPPFAPTTWWNDSHARVWRHAAMEVLRGDAGLVTWNRERALIDAEGQYPEVPATRIGRYLWLDGRYGVDHWARASEFCGDTWTLMHILCEDLTANDQILDGPSAAELLDLASERPTLLVLLAEHIRQQPVLLADLLLHPATSALGCLVIAKWSAQPVWVLERSLQDAEDVEARERAFADAIGIAGHLLRRGTCPIEEMTALLVWMHDCAQADDTSPTRRARRISTRMFEIVRHELLSLSKEQLQSALAALSFRSPDGLGTPRFTAALDLVTFARLISAVDPDQVVATYVASFNSDAVYRDIALTPAQASSLVVIAERSKTFSETSETWEKFLAPIDVRERLTKAKSAENEYVARDAISRALRAHIRVLSRAICAWEGLPLDDVVKALAKAIRNGSCDHAEKARVSAFAARFETTPFVSRPEPPLANDIAAACARLVTSNLSPVEDALMQVDEPLVLAQLLRIAPRAMREKLSKRVNALTPDDAGKVSSLTEVQARIDALLNAGADAVAAQYMAAERDLKLRFGRGREREAVRFRFELRLALLRKDFSEIAKAQVPEDVDKSELESLQDAVNFYKGVAELSNPAGSASTAENLFDDLVRRHPENAAYAVNLFAARLSRLLDDDTFKKLDGDAIDAARSAIEDADRTIANALSVQDETRAIHESNKALLLLAMGQPDRAYEILQRAKSSYGESEHITAYSAVALARMGRVDEAFAALDTGDAVHGESPALKAAREHLERGTPGRFRPIGASDENRIATVQKALFLLSQMGPNEQAQVQTHTTIEAFVAAEVRSAAAGVTALVPMMRSVQLDSCEDDITALLCKILEARVDLFKWSVPDQTKGGFSAKGNPGERDLVVRKNGYVVTVIEAVVCKANPSTQTMKKTLANHFQKLFGYEQCRVFVQLIYSYVKYPHAVLNEMREIAETSAPSDFRFMHMSDLGYDDSRPIGFEATYQQNWAQGYDNIKVIFLVMDMGQQVQRSAAMLAGQAQAAKKPAKGIPIVSARSSPSR